MPGHLQIFHVTHVTVCFSTGAMNATESEFEPISDYEGEGAISDYEARSEFDDTDDWDKDKSMSKRSARVRFEFESRMFKVTCIL